MSTKLLVPSLILSLIFLSSCSHRLVGTWNVESYETSRQGSQGVKLNNIGEITFKSNGSGEKNLTYEVFQIKREDHLPFRWVASDMFVTLDGDEEQSEFIKTWIIVENKRKSQLWRSTDGQNQVQTLELRKQ